jgi:hypothetical protein
MKNGHAKKKLAKLTIPVAYGNVSFDDKAAHVPITIRRGELGAPTLYEVDRNLCGRQLTASILARPMGAKATQPDMFGNEEDIQVNGIFEVGSLTVHLKKITASLEVPLDKTLDRGKLTCFAKREGLLTIEHVHALADGKPEDAQEVAE